MPKHSASPDHKRRRLIASLRAKGLTYAAIGKRLGVTHQSVFNIINGEKRINARVVGCKECGEVIARGALANKTAQGVFCLSCLARHPQTPFRQRLRAYRVAAGMTRRELAQRAGVKVENVEYYEGTSSGGPQRSKVRPLVQVLGARILGLGVDERERRT